MRLAIVGSRDFSDYALLKSSIKVDKVSHVISGGARGADALARKFAEEFGIPFTEYKAEWEKHGKKAGFVRNKLIVEACDALIAFWDGQSKGTEHSIKLAKKMGKPIKIINFKEKKHDEDGRAS